MLWHPSPGLRGSLHWTPHPPAGRAPGGGRDRAWLCMCDSSREAFRVWQTRQRPGTVVAPAAWVLGHRGLRRPQEAPGISHCPQCGVLAATSPGPGGPGCPTLPGVSPPTASRVSAGPRRGCGTSSKADACRHRVPRATGPKGPGCHQLLERGHPTSHTPSCCTGLQRPVTATPCVGRQGNPKPGIQKATHN